MLRQGRKSGGVTVEQDKIDKAHRILYLFGAPSTILLALLVARVLGSGLTRLLQNPGEMIEHPFRNESYEDSP